jgi:hypothetical protein
MYEDLTQEVLQDELAISVACIIAAANKSARAAGVNVAESLVTITQMNKGSLFWRVNYGVKDHFNQRGGDVIIDVSASDGRITHVQKGQ